MSQKCLKFSKSTHWSRNTCPWLQRLSKLHVFFLWCLHVLCIVSLHFYFSLSKHCSLHSDREKAVRLQGLSSKITLDAQAWENECMGVDVKRRTVGSFYAQKSVTRCHLLRTTNNAGLIDWTVAFITVLIACFADVNNRKIFLRQGSSWKWN